MTALPWTSRSCGCRREPANLLPHRTTSPQQSAPSKPSIAFKCFFFLKLHPLNISTGHRWKTTQPPLLQRPFDDPMVSFQKPSKSNWIFEVKSFRISFQITVGKSMYSKTNISPSSKTLYTAGTTYLSHWKYHCRSHQLQDWLLCSDCIPHTLILKLYIPSSVFNHELRRRVVLAFGTSLVSELLSHVGFSRLCRSAIRLLISGNIPIDLHRKISPGGRKPLLAAPKLRSFPLLSLANRSLKGFGFIQSCFRPSTQSRKKSALVDLPSQQVWTRKKMWRLLTLMHFPFSNYLLTKIQWFLFHFLHTQACPLAPRWKHPNLKSHLLANE